MSLIKCGLILVGFGAAAVAGGIYFGAIHPGADQPHSSVVFKLIETARDRGISVRAQGVVVPALGGEAQVLSGAGNYAAMCTTCHLAPGMAPTELSKGLYPAPPMLTELGAADPARAFWAIKHGLKASGMPAWGKSMSDEYIWNMVAFLQQAPGMSAEQYQTLVASSGGHAHGGGESMPDTDAMPGMNGDHHDDAGAPSYGHDDSAVPPAHDDAGAPPHDHGAPTPAPAPATHDDTRALPHDHAPAVAPTAQHGGH